MRFDSISQVELSYENSNGKRKLRMYCAKSLCETSPSPACVLAVNLSMPLNAAWQETCLPHAPPSLLARAWWVGLLFTRLWPLQLNLLLLLKTAQARHCYLNFDGLYM